MSSKFPTARHFSQNGGSSGRNSSGSFSNVAGAALAIAMVGNLIMIELNDLSAYQLQTFNDMILMIHLDD
jgi:hypothetical protein